MLLDNKLASPVQTCDERNENWKGQNKSNEDIKVTLRLDYVLF